MMKAHQYRIYPTNTQVQQFNMHFGVCRFVYNKALALKKSHYESQQKSLSKREIQDKIIAMKSTDEYAWLYDVNSQSILAALDNLHTAFQNFFQGRSGFPKFKSRRSNWQSFQCPQHVKVLSESGQIKLPKIGKVKARLHREIPQGSKIKTCTIKRNPSGQYTISVLFECSDQPPIPSTVEEDKTLGIDMGIKVFYADSDGGTEKNPRHLGHALDCLARQQKILARKKKDSHNREKQRRLVAKTHMRVANARHDFQHQLTAKLCRDNQATSFAVEDLNVKGMVRNRKLSRQITDVAWGAFLVKLTYNSEWNGKNVLVIDRWHPSSKTCSFCGWKNKALKLSDRIFSCQVCGHEQDRDTNASINIKKEAIRIHQAGAACDVKSSPETIVVDATVSGERCKP